LRKKNRINKKLLLATVTVGSIEDFKDIEDAEDAVAASAYCADFYYSCCERCHLLPVIDSTVSFISGNCESNREHLQ